MIDRYKDKYPSFDYDCPVDRVLRISFNRPETYNSIDSDGHHSLAYIWQDIDKDNDINAVILTGKGKAFSAGGDFGMIRSNIEDWNHSVQAYKEAHDLVYNVINCSKPIVSAINGVAVGAGLVAALLADISIMAKSARLSDGHTRLGVAAGDVACINWVLLCGMAKAKYYLLTCDAVYGEEAERIGLVSRCVDDSELEEESIRIAAKLATAAPTAARWTKLALNNWYRMAGPIFDNSLALEMFGFKGPEIQEGLSALLEKRAPKFDPNSSL